MTMVELPNGARCTRQFHVSRHARQRYGVDASLVDLRGRVLVTDPARAERVAARINEVRGRDAGPFEPVRPPDLLAAGLLDEALHLLLAAYRREADPDWLARLEAALIERHGRDAVDGGLEAFVEAYPPDVVASGERSAGAYLEGELEGLPHRHVALEEWVTLGVALDNPALARLRELFLEPSWDRRAQRMGADLHAGLAGLAGFGGEANVAALLWAPIRAHPTSMTDQLGYVRERWSGLLGPGFHAFWTRLLRSSDLLREAAAARPPGPPGPAPVLQPGVGGGDDEPEAYSRDEAWMPRAVLVAKSTYVWLDQLATRFGREMRRLDQIPDEALDELRRYGFDALWLIGVWERSPASRRIKHRLGQLDAVASAYAVYDYRIADDLGGENALEDLRERAAARGLRLASDMVPNHVGIDGRWVVEHPERFLSLDEPPFPGYAFEGPDLADDPSVEIRIEDHYWDQSDAAVVFERKDTRTGERRYLYHGNDGTSTPWNDTAQLDYLDAGVREAVIDTIVDVARRFPIIRFDAAMTLAKRHVRRLWYPEPGEGGAIPSRSEHGALPEGEFERRMPVEFWRDVVERVAREAPGTLLLAEAFWMMEGYFVRSLGMHRVYNSAFMNMLAREANGEYRQLMKNVLAFDPRMLQRFVNFMNNPDEETAIEQFGDGDKAFGVTTLMATLPGLPMFGHGQVEGLREKYGMEYRRALRQESADPAMVARHEREIAPLLRRREAFAGADAFRLFDLVGSDGSVAEDAYAFVNRGDGGAHLVLFHNRYAEADGRLHESAPFVPADGGETRTASLAEALGLRGGEDRYLRLRDARTGLEELHRSEDVVRDGLGVALRAFETRVYLDIEEVHDVDGSLRRLHERAGGTRVRSLEAAARAMEVRPVHRALDALRAAERPSAQRAAWRSLDQVLRDVRDGGRLPAERARRAGRRWAALRRQPASGGARGAAAELPLPPPVWRDALVVALATDRPSERWDRLHLSAYVRDAMGEAHGEVPAEAWAALPPLLLRAVERGEPPLDAEAHARALLSSWEQDEAAQRWLGVHRWSGERWFARERLRAYLAGWGCALRLTAHASGTTRRAQAHLLAAERASEYRFDRLLQSGPPRAAPSGRGGRGG